MSGAGLGSRLVGTSVGLSNLSFVALLSATAFAGEWEPHEVRQINGMAGDVRLAAKFQIVTKNWNRVVAVPYLAYLPEKDRLLMLVSCDYPHHAEISISDDRGASWSSPKPARVGSEGKPLAGLGTSLCYLGEGTVLFYSSRRWLSRDYGQTWKESVPLEAASDGKPWYTWDPPLVERDAKTGKVTRLVETGYTWFKPPEVRTAHQQAYLRFSTDGGKSWSPIVKGAPMGGGQRGGVVACGQWPLGRRVPNRHAGPAAARGH